MLTITKPSSNRVDIELSGSLDEAEMRRSLDAFSEASEGVSHGKMLYRIADFEMPTLGALAVEFAQMPKLLGLVRRFDKCAVLSDAAWIRTAAEIEGVVFPGLQIKSFALSGSTDAEDWLADNEDDDFGDNVPV